MINYDWRPANQPLMYQLMCQSYLHVLQLRYTSPRGLTCYCNAESNKYDSSTKKQIVVYLLKAL